MTTNTNTVKSVVRQYSEGGRKYRLAVNAIIAGISADAKRDTTFSKAIREALRESGSPITTAMHVLQDAREGATVKASKSERFLSGDASLAVVVGGYMTNYAQITRAALVDHLRTDEDRKARGTMIRDAQRKIGSFLMAGKAINLEGAIDMYRRKEGKPVYSNEEPTQQRVPDSAPEGETGSDGPVPKRPIIDHTLPKVSDEFDAVAEQMATLIQRAHGNAELCERMERTTISLTRLTRLVRDVPITENVAPTGVSAESTLPEASATESPLPRDGNGNPLPPKASAPIPAGTRIDSRGNAAAA